MTARVLAAILISLLAVTAAQADRQAWEKKVISNVHIEIPSDCKTDVQTTPGVGGAVQKMTRYSFRTHVLDLELVFLSFLPGTGENLDGAVANMSSQLKEALGEERFTPWKIITVSGRPARHIATKPDRTREARQATSSTIQKLRTNSS